ncbi:hypothetical protein J0645_10075 [Streptococcus suis]|uniref:hypothetical protein n=1 Tax=Streptococcus suis TaxID=1307 RepID=UPI001E3BF621|nr:hypothetical protein [Streptococcus suis]MCB2958413.1 hypothetical protein [Streptococcus suis]
MHISNGIGRINLIENLVALTGNPFEMYQEKSMYELALDLKIAKLQVGIGYTKLKNKIIEVKRNG